MISQTTGSSRIPEFLESLKSEFETLIHDRDLYKMQKDEYERKCMRNTHVHMKYFI